MSLTIKICKNTIILSNKAFSSLKETYLSFRDYPNLRHRCPLKVFKHIKYARTCVKITLTFGAVIVYMYVCFDQFALEVGE